MKHFIFDQDGTLFDTEFTVSEITADIATRYGAPVSAIDVFVNCAGYSSRDKFTWAAQKNHKSFTEDELSAMREEHGDRKDALYSQKEITVMPGLVACLDDLQQAGCLLSVGSNNPTSRIVKGLLMADLVHYFNDRVYGPDLVGNVKKPDPAVFLHAMAVSHSDPSDTFIVEDSLAGVVAARAVGAFVIAFMHPIFERAGYGPEMRVKLRESGADLVVSSYASLFGSLENVLSI